MTSELTIVAPGLLGPVPLLPEQAPATPALDLLLRRGRYQPESDVGAASTSLTQTLLERFGASASAPYARAADDPSWDHHGVVMHADPVHLRPDRDRLRLFDARHLGISRDEAEALVQEVNAHLADDGLRLVAPVASRWYLELVERPCLETHPLESLIGRHIDGFLPTGADAGRWAALMSELQMLLFQSPVNREREARGRPAVNALWPAGGGEWQPLVAPSGLTQICADHPLARGLAMASGLDLTERDGYRPAPGVLRVDAEMADGMLDADPDSWCSAVVGVEAHVAQALQALRAGTLEAVMLNLCDGRQWQLTRSRLRRFWQRPRALVERLDQPRAHQ